MIIFPDGSMFDLENLSPPNIVGYRIVHILTGRILPGTNRNELYTLAAAFKKMKNVAILYNAMQSSLDIWDYEPIPVYDIECPPDYIKITDVNDYLFE